SCDPSTWVSAWVSAFVAIEPPRSVPTYLLTVALPANRPSKQETLGLFAGLPRRYDLAGALLSFGQDPRWRRAMVAEVHAARADRDRDVAPGTGMVAACLVRRYGCQVVGLDQSREMLAGAQAKLDAEPELAARIELVSGEAEALPVAGGGM